MAEHAVLSASAAHRWIPCPGSIVLEQERGGGRGSTSYAAEGTAAHTILERLLRSAEPVAYTGVVLKVDGFEIQVDQDMTNHTQHVADTITEVAQGGLILSERRVTYGSYFETDLSAFGTADVIVVNDTELQVHDLKYGQGEQVSAEDNEQMKLYALGALVEVEDSLGPFENVRLFIHQPRISKAPSEWSISVEDLKKWGKGRANSAAVSVKNAMDCRPLNDARQWEDAFLNPGPKQCRWCKAKATCPKLAKVALDTIGNRDNSVASIDEFDALQVPNKKHLQPAATDWLASAMAKADMIEGWITAVRAEVERRLLAGESVDGFKIVRGKQGNRNWSNAAEVEALFKDKFRLKVEDMYDLKLISPTTAEKLAEKKVLGPRQWAGLQDKITRSEGKLHVAPADDPRAAISVGAVADEFSPASAPADDLC